MTRQHNPISRLSDGSKHTLIRAMGLWGQGDQLSIEVTARQGDKELRRSPMTSPIINTFATDIASRPCATCAYWCGDPLYEDHARCRAQGRACPTYTYSWSGCIWHKDLTPPPMCDMMDLSQRCDQNGLANRAEH